MAHPVDVAFSLLAIGWLAYLLRITGDMSFWSDDLRVIEQAGSWGGLLRPYNQHMSLVPLASDRLLAEISGFSYTPFILFGALSFLAVAVSYYLTTRRQLGAPLAAILAVLLLWPDGLNTRPASASHYLALVGAIVCAAALNRGRRADGPLALALLFSLCSAGGGVVVAGACLVHNFLVQPPLRRWLAVLVPSALWGGWWFFIAEAAGPTTAKAVNAGETARIVRDLCLAPFYAAGFGNRVLAYALMTAFLVHGALLLRRGLRAGANFLVWSAAIVAWAFALVQSRGSGADAQTFRYTYLSLGFALLAVVPREAIRWPEPVALANRRWLAASAAMVMVFGAVSGLTVRGELQDFARRNAALGREADGTMLVLGLGPQVIPDSTRIVFFGFNNPHGTARRLRALMDRYGSPFDATIATADQRLVDLEIVRRHPAGSRPHPGCQPLTQPLFEPGLVTRGLGEPAKGEVFDQPAAEPLQLWSSEPFTIDVRRYGDAWVRLAEVRAGRNVVLTLPALSTERPWEVRADGACDVRP